MYRSCSAFWLQQQSIPISPPPALHSSISFQAFIRGQTAASAAAICPSHPVPYSAALSRGQHAPSCGLTALNERDHHTAAEYPAEPAACRAMMQSSSISAAFGLIPSKTSSTHGKEEMLHCMRSGKQISYLLQTVQNPAVFCGSHFWCHW